MTKEINEKKLKELFDGAAGRQSHFLFLGDEPQEFIDLAIREGWLKSCSWNGQSKSSEDNPLMYQVTNQLVEKFRRLSKDEKSQIAYQAKSELEKAELEKQEQEEKEEMLRKQLAPNEEL